MKTYIRCKAVSETMTNLGIFLTRVKDGIKSLIIKGDDGEITGSLTVDEHNDAVKLAVQNGSNTTSLTLHATDGGEHYAELGTPSANAPSLAVVNKAYVESTEVGANNLVHKTSAEDIWGHKYFGNAISSLREFDVTVTPSGVRNIGYIINQVDVNKVQIFNIWAQQQTDGHIVVFLGIRNKDGTQKNIVIGTGD